MRIKKSEIELINTKNKELIESMENKIQLINTENITLKYENEQLKKIILK